MCAFNEYCQTCDVDSHFSVHYMREFLFFVLCRLLALILILFLFLFFKTINVHVLLFISENMRVLIYFLLIHFDFKEKIE
jgi:hypothetical protein